MRKDRFLVVVLAGLMVFPLFFRVSLANDAETQQALFVLREGSTSRQLNEIVQEASQKAPQNRILRFLAEIGAAKEERDRKARLILQSFEPPRLAAKLDNPSEMVSLEEFRMRGADAKEAEQNAIRNRALYLQIQSDALARVERTAQELGNPELVAKLMQAFRDHCKSIEPIQVATIDGTAAMYREAAAAAEFRVKYFNLIKSTPGGFEVFDKRLEEELMAQRAALKSLESNFVRLGALELLHRAAWDKTQRELLGLGKRAE